MPLTQELRSDHLLGFGMPLGIGQRAGMVGRDEQLQLPLFRADLGDVDLEVTNRIERDRFELSHATRRNCTVGLYVGFRA